MKSENPKATLRVINFLLDKVNTKEEYEDLLKERGEILSQIFMLNNLKGGNR